MFGHLPALPMRVHLVRHVLYEAMPFSVENPCARHRSALVNLPKSIRVLSYQQQKYLKNLPYRMKNQNISKRYIKKKDLIDLLERLFGSNYFLEVGHQRTLRSLF